MEYLEQLMKPLTFPFPMHQYIVRSCDAFTWEYEKMNFQLYKEDIFQLLKKGGNF